MNNDYLERINKVIKYIEENYAEKISLDSLAEASHFSKYHFSRIFTSIMGETPISFVTKIRLQKAILELKETTKSIADIANGCGFESISTFNASFKKYYQTTPSDWRKSTTKDSNILGEKGKIQEEIAKPPCYSIESKNSFLRRIWTMNITLKQLPDMEVAYVRHVGSYLETYHAWERLGMWSNSKGLYPTEQFFIGISLDDPNVTEEHECRYDACVTLPANFVKKSEDGIDFKRLSGGTYALYQFYDTIDKLAIAYQTIFGQWLPNSEYDADDKPCLEFCMNNPAMDPDGKAKVDLYIPLKQN